MSRPLQISAETAVKLSEQLGVPIEHLMHMPRHILLQKMAELAAKEAAEPGPKDKPES
ncbi:YycC family protein [Paenibacillus sp. 1P07SE]|uniref:YycC family protein n=1 Tax=Paenibacillus sp. 1P07SE TaxID=3132209 RepID=UPI0039A52B6A